jgi:hypothetical protein
MHPMDLGMFMFAELENFELIISKPYLDMFISNGHKGSFISWSNLIAFAFFL